MRKGQQTRRDIVDEALVMAGEVGLEYVTLGSLASELDLSKSGLFAHFESKEALQVAVLESAVERFKQLVIQPALAAPRGEPRFRALFEAYLQWMKVGGGDGRGFDPVEERRTGGCIFMALSQEYDDRPGKVRDAVVQSQREWRQFVAGAARLGISEGHFRPDLDVEQVAFEFVGIGMTCQQTSKLLQDPEAEPRARTAFRSLLARCRARPELRPRVVSRRENTR